MQSDKLNAIDYKHGNEIRYYLNKGNVIIEQHKPFDNTVTFYSWCTDNFLGEGTVAVFRITKLK